MESSFCDHTEIRHDGREPVVKFRRGASNASDGGADRESYEDVDLGTGGTDGGSTGRLRRNTAELASGFGSIVGGVGEVDADALGLCEDEFTVEQAVEAIGFGWFQIKISALVGFCWMADAIEMMLLSIISPELRCLWNLERWQEALITTVVFIGMFTSSTLWGKMCDKYGRRTGLIACTTWLFYHGLLSSFAPTYVWILILRGLVGFGIGGVPQSITLYTEFLPSKTRGMCVVFTAVFWAFGTVVEVLLALIVMPTLGWHYLLLFSAFPVLIFVLSCKWLPESARYYVACGNQQKAHEILKAVALANNKPMPLGKLKIEEVPVKRGSYADLFKTKEMGITTVLLLFIWFANAFAYYGIVLMSTELFATGNTCSSEGQSQKQLECFDACKSLTTNDYVLLLWTTLAEFPGIILTFVIIEKLGRKKTMAVEFLFFAIFVFLLFICSSMTLMTVFLFAARGFISGAFQAAYVYTPEVYPTATRALGVGSCSAMARIGALLTPFVAQVMLGVSPHLAISIYGGVALVAVIACLALPVETKGREMQTVATKSKPKSATSEAGTSR
ncbi:synaptic vesicle 2-related protein-like isoform X2 [Patiria miniata]|uniref:Major facilitator superfamily (MFS) profile domain-containing protein n=1 Tax=Patiria miniata TaxID=46514 RepID=A0A914A7G1_PATMI|nr:synaptic vesicle 2-related protein-like isoform X1 [Patiria miniata]XP_038059726.1 synaptic vesicle 2-related protein-like isoform X2 [Patiria miniata]